MGIDSTTPLKWSRKVILRYTSKKTVDNYFILYDMDDIIVCYFDNFKELSKYINYRYRDLVYEFNNKNTNIINIKIGEIKYKLAIFC